MSEQQRVQQIHKREQKPLSKILLARPAVEEPTAAEIKASGFEMLIKDEKATTRESKGVELAELSADEDFKLAEGWKKDEETEAQNSQKKDANEEQDEEETEIKETCQSENQAERQSRLEVLKKMEKEKMSLADVWIKFPNLRDKIETRLGGEGSYSYKSLMIELGRKLNKSMKAEKLKEKLAKAEISLINARVDDAPQGADKNPPFRFQDLRLPAGWIMIIQVCVLLLTAIQMLATLPYIFALFVVIFILPRFRAETIEPKIEPTIKALLWLRENGAQAVQWIDGLKLQETEIEAPEAGEWIVEIALVVIAVLVVVNLLSLITSKRGIYAWVMSYLTEFFYNIGRTFELSIDLIASLWNGPEKLKGYYENTIEWIGNQAVSLIEPILAFGSAIKRIFTCQTPWWEKEEPAPKIEQCVEESEWKPGARERVIASLGATTATANISVPTIPTVSVAGESSETYQGSSVSTEESQRQAEAAESRNNWSTKLKGVKVFLAVIALSVFVLVFDFGKGTYRLAFGLVIAIELFSVLSYMQHQDKVHYDNLREKSVTTVLSTRSPSESVFSTSTSSEPSFGESHKLMTDMGTSIIGTMLESIRKGSLPRSRKTVHISAIKMTRDIRCELSSDRPFVDVTLAGKVGARCLIDSGASVSLIGEKTVQQLERAAGEDAYDVVKDEQKRVSLTTLTGAGVSYSRVVCIPTQVGEDVFHIIFLVVDSTISSGVILGFNALKCMRSSLVEDELEYYLEFKNQPRIRCTSKPQTRQAAAMEAHTILPDKEVNVEMYYVMSGREGGAQPPLNRERHYAENAEGYDLGVDIAQICYVDGKGRSTISIRNDTKEPLEIFKDMIVASITPMAIMDETYDLSKLIEDMEITQNKDGTQAENSSDSMTAYPESTTEAQRQEEIVEGQPVDFDIDKLIEERVEAAALEADGVRLAGDDNDGSVINDEEKSQSENSTDAQEEQETKDVRDVPVVRKLEVKRKRIYSEFDPGEDPLSREFKSTSCFCSERYGRRILLTEANAFGFLGNSPLDWGKAQCGPTHERVFMNSDGQKYTINIRRNRLGNYKGYEEDLISVIQRRRDEIHRMYGLENDEPEVIVFVVPRIQMVQGTLIRLLKEVERKAGVIILFRYVENVKKDNCIECLRSNIENQLPRDETCRVKDLLLFVPVRGELLPDLVIGSRVDQAEAKTAIVHIKEGIYMTLRELTVNRYFVQIHIPFIWLMEPDRLIHAFSSALTILKFSFPWSNMQAYTTNSGTQGIYTENVINCLSKSLKKMKVCSVGQDRNMKRPIKMTETRDVNTTNECNMNLKTCACGVCREEVLTNDVDILQLFAPQRFVNEVLFEDTDLVKPDKIDRQGPQRGVDENCLADDFETDYQARAAFLGADVDYVENERTEMMRDDDHRAHPAAYLQNLEAPARDTLPRADWEKKQVDDPMSYIDTTGTIKSCLGPLERLIFKFKDTLISFSSGDHRVFRGYQLKLKLSDYSPFFCRPYPVKEILLPVLKGLFMDLIDRGVCGLYTNGVMATTPAFLVPHNSEARAMIEDHKERRKRGEVIPKVEPPPGKAGFDCYGVRWRLVSDLQKINARLTMSTEDSAIIGVSDSISRLAGSKVISIFDLKAAFYSCPVSPCSRPWLGVSLPVSFGGTVVYTLSPLGLACLPSVFQRVLYSNIRPSVLQHTILHIDDLAVFSQTEEEHTKLLHDLFEDLDRIGVLLDSSKIRAYQSEVTYLGFRVSGSTCKVLERRQLSQATLPLPRTKGELATFLGMLQFHMSFLQDYASLSGLLTPLLRANVAYAPSDLQNRTMRELRDMFLNAPTLYLLNKEQKVIIVSDSSAWSGASCVYQEDGNNVRLIGFYSCKYSQSEIANNSSLEKELLSILKVCVHYRHIFSIGCPVVLKTDCRVLVLLFAVAGRQRSNKCSRWLGLLLSIAPDIIIEWVSSKNPDLVVADYLSRIPMDSARFSNKCIINAEKKNELFAKGQMILDQFKINKEFLSLKDIKEIGDLVGQSPEFNKIIGMYEDEDWASKQNKTKGCTSEQLDDLEDKEAILEVAAVFPTLRSEGVIAAMKMKKEEVERQSEKEDQKDSVAPSTVSSSNASISPIHDAIKKARWLRGVAPVTFERIMLAQAEDKHCSETISKLTRTKASERLKGKYAVVGGLLIRKKAGILAAGRIILPQALALETMCIQHLLGGHAQVRSTIYRFYALFHCKNAEALAKLVVHGCKACLCTQQKNRSDVLVGKIPEAAKFGDSWHIDHVYMKKTAVDGLQYNYLLSVADRATKMQLGAAVRTMSGKETAKVLKNLFALMGPPKSLHSDNGPGLVRSKEVMQLCQEEGVTTKVSVANRPTAHGFIEAMNKTYKNACLVASRSVGASWAALAGKAKFAINITPRQHSLYDSAKKENVSIMASAHELVFNTQPDPERSLVGLSPTMKQRILKGIKEYAERENSLRKRKDKEHPEDFGVGDLVLLKRDPRQKRAGTWNEPAIFTVEDRNHRAVKIRPLFGKSYTRGTLYKHVQELKKYADVRELDILPETITKFFAMEYPPTKMSADLTEKSGKKKLPRKLTSQERADLAESIFKKAEHQGEILVQPDSVTLEKTDDTKEKTEDSSVQKSAEAAKKTEISSEEDSEKKAKTEQTVTLLPPVTPIRNKPSPSSARKPM